MNSRDKEKKWSKRKENEQKRIEMLKLMLMIVVHFFTIQGRTTYFKSWWISMGKSAHLLWLVMERKKKRLPEGWAFIHLFTLPFFSSLLHSSLPFLKLIFVTSLSLSLSLSNCIRSLFFLWFFYIFILFFLFPFLNKESLSIHKSQNSKQKQKF